MKELLSSEKIALGVSNMARQINIAVGKQPLTIIGIMTGSIVMLADLIRLLEMPLRVGVIQTSSYREGTSPGDLVVNSSMMPDISNRDLLLVDDIFDTGHTLDRVVRRVGSMGPTSVTSAVLLRKTTKTRKSGGRRRQNHRRELPMS